jgi:hypothetical protein
MMNLPPYGFVTRVGGDDGRERIVALDNIEDVGGRGYRA